VTRIRDTLHKNLFTFVIIPTRIPFRMRNASNKICRENQNTYFTVKNFFSQKSCRLRDNVEKYDKARQAADDNRSGACALHAG
jgi:hypothetical protein